MQLHITQDSLGENAYRQIVDQKSSSIEIHVDENVKALVIVEIEPSVSTVIINSDVSNYAELTVLCVQSPLATFQKISQVNQIGEGSKLHCKNITLGSQVEHALVSHLTGAHAVSSVDWIVYANKKEKQKISATNVFNAANGGGEIAIKGVAEDTAHMTCNGMIDIESNGGGTDTYLTEEVLMLDSGCTVDAIPGLEIKTNDVKASHSATVSKVTDADLFYFAARGIPQKQAREMYVLGFLGQMIQQLPDPQIGEHVMAAIAQKYS